MFNVVTISREYGSGGGMIAEMLAQRLGWKLVDKSLVVEVAKRAQVELKTAASFDESVDPWFHSLVKSLWRGGYEGSASTVDITVIDSEGMAKISGEIIREAATLGRCVIVGRGSQCVLHHHRNIFHVSVFGPRHEKIQRLRERLSPDKDPERTMDEMDRRRAAYIDRFYARDWKDRRLYHLVISTTLGLDTVTNTIVCAAGVTPKTT